MVLFSWITVSQSQKHQVSYMLRELWGRCSRVQTVLLMNHKNTLSPPADAYTDLITPHWIVPVWRLAAFGCLGTVVAMECCARPRYRNQSSSLRAKRSPPTGSSEAVPCMSTCPHRILGILDCTPGPSCPEHQKTFLVSAGNEWETDNTHCLCGAETASAYIFLSWSKISRRHTNCRYL